MEVIYPRCCGLDVHQRTVVARLMAPASVIARSRRPSRGA